MYPPSEERVEAPDRQIVLRELKETFRKLNKKTGVCCIAEGQPCSSDAECCLGQLQRQPLPKIHLPCPAAPATLPP